MEILTIIFLILLLVVVILIVLYLMTKRELDELKKINEKLRFDYRSKVVKHGKNWENFVPFMPDFEKIANKDNFVFLGMPIDGISFDDDNIKFIEIKTGTSQLNQKQRKIRDMVRDKKVKWHELRY